MKEDLINLMELRSTPKLTEIHQCWYFFLKSSLQQLCCGFLGSKMGFDGSGKMGLRFGYATADGGVGIRSLLCGHGQRRHGLGGGVTA